MKSITLLATLLGLVIVGASTATAQPPVPDQGSTGAGGEIGLLFPADERLQTGLAVDGLYEYYVTPRVGVRVMLGWSDPEFERSARSLRQVRLTMGVNYNWEGGAWHPFVGAGVGVYFLKEKREGRDPDGETKGGFHLAGGFEYFTQRDTTIMGELRYHAVADTAAGLDPSGLALAVGLKRYF